MPTTEENVYLIHRKCANATIPEIISAMDEVQLITYSQNCFQTTKIESTGLPPILATTNLVYEYNCPSDCRKTAAVFIESPTRGYSRVIGYEREYYFHNKRYVAVDGEGRSANINTVAKFYFKDNPGTTTDKYYHLYYLKPTRITDISIELTLPEETHYLLRKAVIAMFTTEEYGESPLDAAVIEKVAKKIRASLNSGYGSSLGITQWQPEYLDYPGAR
jgi:hypothetical protein